MQRRSTPRVLVSSIVVSALFIGASASQAEQSAESALWADRGFRLLGNESLVEVESLPPQYSLIPEATSAFPEFPVAAKFIPYFHESESPLWNVDDLSAIREAGVWEQYLAWLEGVSELRWSKEPFGSLTWAYLITRASALGGADYGVFLSRVRNWGRWDYKRLDRDRFEAAGNVNFGMLLRYQFDASAPWIPDEAIYYGAGSYQVVTNIKANLVAMQRQLTTNLDVARGTADKSVARNVFSLWRNPVAQCFLPESFCDNPEDIRFVTQGVLAARNSSARDAHMREVIGHPDSWAKAFGVSARFEGLRREAVERSYRQHREMLLRAEHARRISEERARQNEMLAARIEREERERRREQELKQERAERQALRAEARDWGAERGAKSEPTEKWRCYRSAKSEVCVPW